MNEANKSVWSGPKGLILVTSGKAEDANVYNRAYLDHIHVEMRVIDSVERNSARNFSASVFRLRL